jgi:ABC-2 type transport system permease protein
MWRASVLVGRSLADLATFFLCALIVGVTGLAVGWRPGAGLGSVAGGFALVLLFAYSLTWITICVGLTSKSPESAASSGFIVLFPLAFVSNAMVPTQHMRSPASRAEPAGTLTGNLQTAGESACSRDHSGVTFAAQGPGGMT